MIDWTDRHCRFFHRLLAPKARLYTEMITTGALHYSDPERHLDFDEAEHPVALQLGGSDTAALATSARMGERWGYDEINLNCGCPSERVLKGSFGACLMSDPVLVADCFKAMRDVVDVPVTIKHRIGLDHNESYGFVRDFVGTLYDAGCRVFIVHARNAMLKGLSPKENREIPPLRYDVARQLKRDFPDAVIVLNGGLKSAEQVLQELLPVDGIRLDGAMIGREAYQRPRSLSEMSAAMWPDVALPDDAAVVDAMARYTAGRIAAGEPMRMIARHILNLVNGQDGARRWRQMLSDNRLLARNDAALIQEAWQTVVDAARDRVAEKLAYTRSTSVHATN